jgi:hypothetical protein
MQNDSDELRVYDIDNNRLKLAFVWRSQAPGELRQQPEGDHPAFLFRWQGANDFDNNGKVEVVGAFERVTLASAPFPVPVLLSWDEGANRYHLSPLLTTAPPLPPTSGVDPSVVSGYVRPTIIRNNAQQDRPTLRAFAAAEYDVRRAPRAPLLTAYFVLPSNRPGRPASGYLRYYFLDLQDATPTTLECLAVMTNKDFGGFTGSDSRVLRDRLARAGLRAGGPCTS